MKVIKERNPFSLIDYFEFKAKLFGSKLEKYPKYFGKEIYDEDFELLGVENVEKKSAK